MPDHCHSCLFLLIALRHLTESVVVICIPQLLAQPLDKDCSKDT